MAGCCCFDMIQTSEVGIVERFGKFSRVAEAGCFPVCCCIEGVMGKLSLRVQELQVVLETKTLDNVFVQVTVSIQYQIIKDKVYNAFYLLEDTHSQMSAYVHDSIRSALCGMNLDHAFEAKDEISIQLKSHLQEVMNGFGLHILNALVTELSPDIKVRNAMNEINASRRLKEAAYQRAEGEKILRVKKAEADAESMYLSGVGVAKQRKAIMDGLKDSITVFAEKVDGTTPKDIMDLLVLNQYFDMLQDIGKNPSANCVFMAGNDSSVRKNLLEAEAAKNK